MQANDAATAATELNQADPADVLGRQLLAESHTGRGQAAEAAALRTQVLGTFLFPPGAARTIEFFTLVAHTRARAAR